MEKVIQKEQIYSSEVLEFVTIAVEFCAFLEKENSLDKNEWIGRMLKILPLMYVKASMLPEYELEDEIDLENFVKEEDYARVLNVIANILEEEDVYLDVFMEEMKYSDIPISSTVSEDIADIYQDVRNFVSVYQYGIEDSMAQAIAVCSQNFKTFWGQKLVNTLRPLHNILYSQNDMISEDSEQRDSFWV